MLKEKVFAKIVGVHKCWWIKINKKAIRKNLFDGAVFPYIVTLEYEVDGKIYKKRKFKNYENAVPNVNDKVEILYDKQNPRKINF